MIPLAIPNLAGNEAQYLQECIESTFVSSVGAFVDRFEELVADAAGAPRAVAVASGTAGLHLALTAAGVGRDDLVAIPSLTFVATANAVSHAGARPWLFDVSAESWTLDPEQLRDVLARDTERRGGQVRHRATGARLGAILPVHTLGQPADMDALTALAEEYGVPVVADAAAALGATYKGRPVGSLGATFSVFSFNGNKTVTAGGGGAVVADDEDLLALARHLSTTARATPDYDHDRVGFNYRMTNLQAAVGTAQMEQLGAFVARKREIRERYERGLADLPDVGAYADPPWSETAAWFSGFTLEGARRDDGPRLRAALKARGVDARPFWKPMHLQQPYRDALRERMDVSDELWSRVMTLPCSTGITDAELDEVVEVVRDELT